MVSKKIAFIFWKYMYVDFIEMLQEKKLKPKCYSSPFFMPTLLTFSTFRQYIFMVTDRQHLTGLNHKISSKPSSGQPCVSLISLLSLSLLFPGLWLVSQQPMRGSHWVTWLEAPPPNGQGFPSLCSGLIQFAHISVRVLIKYSNVISKVAWIRTNSHLNSLHTITFLI